MQHIDELTQSLFQGLIEDFKSRGNRLLNVASESEQVLITRTLARIVEEQSLALMSDDPTPHHANINQLTNTLENISAKHGLNAQREAREFVQNLIQKTVEAAVAITFSFVPTATQAVAVAAAVATEPDPIVNRGLSAGALDPETHPDNTAKDNDELAAGVMTPAGTSRSEESITEGHGEGEPDPIEVDGSALVHPGEQDVGVGGNPETSNDPPPPNVVTPQPDSPVNTP